MSKILQKYAKTRPQEDEDDVDVEEDVPIVSKGKKSTKKVTLLTTTTSEPQTTTLKPAKGKVLTTGTSSGKGTSSTGKKGASTTPQSAIIYLGHIPDGFYESEMRKFFRQFGPVKRIRLFRSRKSNKSKGYAFIEFESAEVARTVAQSMNGYFLMERTLVSEVVPVEKHHKLMFAKYKQARWEEDSDVGSGDEDGEDEDSDEELSPEEKQAQVQRTFANLTKKQKQLQDLGIEFEIPTLKPNKRKAEEAPVPVEAPKTQTKKARKEAAPVVEETPVVPPPPPASAKKTKAPAKEAPVVEVPPPTEAPAKKTNNKTPAKEPTPAPAAESIPSKAAPKPSKIARLAKK